MSLESIWIVCKAKINAIVCNYKKHKMRVYLIILFFLSFIFRLTGQTCFFTNLSDSFNFKVELIRHKDKGEYTSSCTVKLSIYRKSSNKINQSITYESLVLFDKVFKNGGLVRSYQTGKNDSLLFMDNDFGDLIVADFNFDGLDDFAIIKDSGGNGGPVYYYYIQNSNSKFVCNKFLSDTMEFFPVKISKKDQTLETHVHIGVCSYSEMIYFYSYKTNTWTRKSHNIIDICK